jgi:hypothetical protein
MHNYSNIQLDVSLCIFITSCKAVRKKFKLSAFEERIKKIR